MKKIIYSCLLMVCVLPSFAAPLPLSFLRPFYRLTIPISYNISNKNTVLYLPSSCSGMMSDALAGEGKMTVSVLGRIQDGQLLVQVKVDYKGKAVTTVGGQVYHITGSMATAETKAVLTEPVDIFLNGYFKLTNENNPDSLFIGDIGFITVYPDGSVSNHIFDPKTPPGYSSPKVYCGYPRT